MIINAHTKIAPILRQNAAALEAIISLSARFEKLRNPLLRKVMAGRTTLAMASRLGGCTLEDFYEKLEPLGFEADRQAKPIAENEKAAPAFMGTLRPDQVKELDVRPVIASGKDPLNIIMQYVKTIQPGQALKIINTFEPAPLIGMLEKKGFETYNVDIAADHTETYFYRTEQAGDSEPFAEPQPAADDWEAMLQKFSDNMQRIDVRHLPMPQPMLQILDALDRLPSGAALFVHHKRIPVFLLPELVDRGFTYRINEIPGGEVRLLIFRQ